jgi:hypothetical protein
MIPRRVNCTLSPKSASRRAVDQIPGNFAQRTRKQVDPHLDTLDLEGGRIGDAEVEARTGPASGLTALEMALSAWVERGREGPAARWFERALDAEGVPKRLPVADWGEGLRRLAEANRLRPEGWPDRFDAMAEGWFRAVLRFSRPDGAPVFGQGGPPEGRCGLFREWAERLSDPGLTTVVDWWFPRRARGRHASPPLPADARPDRPLAVLRANWARDGDFVAVDHRVPATSTRFELFGQGRVLLGPTWTSDVPDAGSTRARPTFWVSHSSADVVEWSFRVGPARVVRTVVLLRGRRIALIGQQWDGPGDPGDLRLALAEGVNAAPIPESRGLSLVTSPRRTSAQVFPIGLPRLNYPTDRGSLGVQGRELVLRAGKVGGANRSWSALLVSWEPKRNRQAVHWRTLTVSENSRACAPGVAFAARVTWGKDDTLVIYRSLGRPGHRAFLGHQTRSRFLVGLFTSEGEVEPLVDVAE